MLEDSPYSIEAITEEELLNEVPEIAYSIALVRGVQNNVEKIDALIEKVLKRMEAKPYRSFRLNHHASE